ncbi:MAG TPA: ATP synthase F1 subunit gamma [Methylomirabilota bacterium]|nr:ATP synthase F1 subunit gamma [Methylomirabilota bacterium]
MPTLLDFRRRIRSVKNTQQITRAMKFVAAARLRRAQDKVIALRPYAKALREVLRSAVSRVEDPLQHPLLARRPEDRLLVVVTAGERGLCGAFNANILRLAMGFLAEHGEKSIEVVTLGKKSRDALSKTPQKIAAEFADVTALADWAKAREIAQLLMARYEAGETDAVYLIYNEFKSVLAPTHRIERLLPIEAERDSAAAPQVDYLYERSAAEIFRTLLPRYVEMQVYRMLAESSAAEHAARMTAMDSATRNASDVIDQLTLYMNKVRQAAITKEIIEVISGATSSD